MEFKEFINMESFIFSMIDEFKFVLSPEQWGSGFNDFSKNEIFVLLLVTRQRRVNMSDIAQYINGPLNTVTGIVSRLEKKGLVERMRDEADRRVVNIGLTADGQELMQREMTAISGLVAEIYTQLTDEEKSAALSMFSKVMGVLRNKSKEEVKEKKIRRITIE